MTKLKDLTGQRFGRLTVVAKGPSKMDGDGTPRVTWLCKCQCGHEIIVRSNSLTTGRTRSCGCWKSETSSKNGTCTRTDLSGKRFGRLLVIEFVGRTKARNSVWKCVCDCGKQVEITQACLASGGTKSCGCLQKDIAAEVHRTHGLSTDDSGKKPRLYRIWSNIRNRCQNPENPNFCHYGARGITVSDEWNDYTIFHAWAITNGYQEELTIDRIDNNRGYSPENCRWVPIIEQVKNRRNSINISIDGEIKSLNEWAKEFSLEYGTVWYRLEQGWPIKKALTTHVGYHKRTE